MEVQYFAASYTCIFGNQCLLVAGMKLPTSLALEHDLRDALDRLAASELRSRSWMAEQLLREGIASRVAASGRAVHPTPDDEQPR